MKNWEKYESHIFNFIRREFTGFEVIKDEKLQGQMSKQKRQVDVVIRRNKKGRNILGSIQCKYQNRKIDLTQLESFISSLEDVGANFGMVVTNSGYTKGARELARAKHIRLEVVDFANLDNFDFVKPNELPDIFMQRTHHLWPYCEKCKRTFLLAIQEVGGFAEFEDINCPKCETVLIEQTRSDGGVKVIDSFKGKLQRPRQGYYPKQVITAIKKMVQETENEWRYWLNGDFLTENSCGICWKEIEVGYPIWEHPNKENMIICIDCMDSMRWLVY